MAKMIMSLVSASACFVSVAGNAFLQATPVDKQFVAARAVEATLLSELSLMGRDEHLSRLQEQLEPMYAALPKNSEGKLDPAVVRYGLHRFFVQSHGWYVQGLQPSGEMWNASSPAELMKDRVPSFIQGLLEKRVHGEGLDLRELAVFAATIQDLVDSEVMQNLMDTLSFLRFSASSTFSEQQLSTIVEMYFMGYLLNVNVSSLSTSKLSGLRSEMPEVYPTWSDARMWSVDLQQTFLREQRSTVTPFAGRSVNFEQVSAMVQGVGHHFGAFQDQECRSMKDRLIEMEFRGTGRVRLSDFYHGGLDGQWMFTESVEYLRATGSLDESDPREASVIIANYIGSPSNCVASSSFYSVCCMDECEGLMSQLERAVGQPSAAPEQIAQLIANMSSDTVDAPRALPPALLKRLYEIADHHGGEVPLHGRLFAQFMHHAYPRECPFPHTSGTTNPMTPDEWMAKHGVPEASEEEIRRHISFGQERSNHSVPEDVHDMLPWTSLEELVAVHEVSQNEEKGFVVALVSKLVLLVSFGALSLPALRSRTHSTKVSDDKLARYLV